MTPRGRSVAATAAVCLDSPLVPAFPLSRPGIVRKALCAQDSPMITAPSLVSSLCPRLAPLLPHPEGATLPPPPPASPNIRPTPF
eukprot:CAMPEP_0177579476 /NCGR_PEP_ID=MMETSP0419_2-20121207/981_1 /TAXON_ID=582737 /ORGANISM="Tetraselmis sp., Strain GSL018" /LENGTH=84 /DNA_ID=CAMNT_0019068147 /DNA_START=126 /DNA_END=380 /DNA_ORIENTATION=-